MLPKVHRRAAISYDAKYYQLERESEEIFRSSQVILMDCAPLCQVQFCCCSPLFSELVVVWRSIEQLVNAVETLWELKEKSERCAMAWAELLQQSRQRVDVVPHNAGG